MSTKVDFSLSDFNSSRQHFKSSDKNEQLRLKHNPWGPLMKKKPKAVNPLHHKVALILFHPQLNIFLIIVWDSFRFRPQVTDEECSLDVFGLWGRKEKFKEKFWFGEYLHFRNINFSIEKEEGSKKKMLADFLLNWASSSVYNSPVSRCRFSWKMSLLLLSYFVDLFVFFMEK